MERIIITAKQAESLLKEGKEIHTFVNPRGMLMGADWSRKEILKALQEAEEIEIGGQQCRKMGHGLVIHRKEQPMLFVEAQEEEILKIERLSVSNKED